MTLKRTIVKVKRITGVNLSIEVTFLFDTGFAVHLLCKNLLYICLKNLAMCKNSASGVRGPMSLCLCRLVHVIVKDEGPSCTFMIQLWKIIGGCIFTLFEGSLFLDSQSFQITLSTPFL